MSESASATHDELTLNHDERGALRHLVETEGAHRLATRWGCGRDVLSRALAGLRLRRGSVFLLRARLAEGRRAA